MCSNHTIFSAINDVDDDKQDDVNNNGRNSIEDCSFENLNISMQQSMKKCYNQLIREEEPSTHV